MSLEHRYILITQAWMTYTCRGLSIYHFLHEGLQHISLVESYNPLRKILQVREGELTGLEVGYFIVNAGTRIQSFTCYFFRTRYWLMLATEQVMM